MPTVTDLRTHLNTPAADTATLQAFLDAATGIAEQYTGRKWTPQTVTQVADGGRTAIILTTGPVQAITTVTESGTTLTTGQWTTDLAAGILYRGGATSPTTWACGRQNVTITYQVGPATEPPTVRHAILELARHLWDTQRGGSQLPRQQGAGDDWDPRQGYSIPRRVAELLDAHRAPGIG